MSVRPQVVFLGICSGDPTLIRHWAAAGHLPNLRRLLDRGWVGRQVSLPGVYVGAHWPSWISGCHPGKNRVHSWQQLQPGSYRQYRCKAGDHAQRPPFWEALSAAGRRVCVLDIPHSRISRGLNGLQTVEWGAHDGAYGFRASSATLAADIRERFGEHPVSGNSDAGCTPEQLVAFRDELIRGIRMKGELTRHYYQQERWDFFAQAFTEAHCGGHLLWHLHDPEYRWDQAGDVLGVGDALRDVYAAIDEAIGGILDGLRQDAIVLLMANHGIGAKYNAQLLLDKMLLALGHAAPRRPDRRADWRAIADPPMTWSWRQLPEGLRKRLRPLRDVKRALIDDRPPPPLLEPADSNVFSIVNNTAHGALRVNLIGREPAGKVAPGADYERLLDTLTEDFSGVVNVETGRPVVNAIYRCDELYPGPERAHLPDLFLDWTNDAPVRAVASNRMPRVEGVYRYVRSGEHRPDGLYVIAGPGIGSGTDAPPVRCMDFAPTIARLLDVRLAGEIDGRPIALHPAVA